MRTKVYYNKPESDCYGCQACLQICPVAAIDMQANREGFLYPMIDSNKCIDCGLCEKSCPTQINILGPLFHSTPEFVDAAWNRDLTLRIESTSGGIFYLLGQKYIENGGIVYGAVFDNNLNVIHEGVKDLDSLKRIRGSKYVQSDITGVLKNVKENLKAGKKVLFSGTPCQVGGLRAFLKVDYPNLLCIDLVCHGVPSPKIFKEHLKYIERKYNSKLIDYKFRWKDKAGWRAYIKYIFDNKFIVKALGKDFFAYNFYKSYFNRLSCFSCSYSCPTRVGDITLSDFWNAEKYDRTLKKIRKYGFNMVMCNTEKGKSAYSEINDQINFEQLPSEIAIQGDVRLRNPEPEPKERKKIFDEYFAYGYDWLIKNRFPKPPIITRIIPLLLKNFISEIKAHL